MIAVGRVGRMLLKFTEVMEVALDQDQVSKKEFWHYPYGQCLAACLLFSPLLRASEGQSFSIAVATGEIKLPKRNSIHAWIDVEPIHEPDENSYVVDPTIGQFSSKDWAEFPAGAIIDTDRALELGYIWHSRLTLEEENDLLSEIHIHRSLHFSSMSCGNKGRALLNVGKHIY